MQSKHLAKTNKLVVYGLIKWRYYVPMYDRMFYEEKDGLIFTGWFCDEGGKNAYYLNINNGPDVLRSIGFINKESLLATTLSKELSEGRETPTLPIGKKKILSIEDDVFGTRLTVKIKVAIQGLLEASILTYEKALPLLIEKDEPSYYTKKGWLLNQEIKGV
jgi:hypothetical protein